MSGEQTSRKPSNTLSDVSQWHQSTVTSTWSATRSSRRMQTTTLLVAFFQGFRKEDDTPSPSTPANYIRQSETTIFTTKNFSLSSFPFWSGNTTFKERRNQSRSIPITKIFSTSLPPRPGRLCKSDVHKSFATLIS